MSAVRELDPLDSATLRGWRILNHVGWGVAGAAATFAVATVCGLVQQRIYEQGHSWSNALVFPAALAAGAVGGALIGAKVYRLPGTVAFLAEAGFFVAWIVWQAIVVGEEMGGAFGVAVRTVFWLLVAIPAVLVARLVWRRRPAALRGFATALVPSTADGTPGAPGTPGR